MSWGRIALIALAGVAVALSLYNASWIAGTPPGRLVVIANRGITQAPRPDAAGPCAAVQILPPDMNYIENTTPAMHQARNLGANGIMIDVRRTADGRMVAFRDEAIDCRTSGRGRVADMSLAALQRVDVGHGYTADGGATFPLRGRGYGLMSTVTDILYEIRNMPLLFVIHDDDPAAADALVAEFARARVEIDGKHGFLAAEPVAARMRTLAPRGWTWSHATSERCLGDYRRTGWTGFVPDSCSGAAVALTPGPNWTLWGWPYRFLKRLIGAGGRIILAAEIAPDGTLRGLTEPEELPEVPGRFRGYLIIEDMPRAGRSLSR